MTRSEVSVHGLALVLQSARQLLTEFRACVHLASRSLPLGQLQQLGSGFVPGAGMTECCFTAGPDFSRAGIAHGISVLSVTRLHQAVALMFRQESVPFFFTSHLGPSLKQSGLSRTRRADFYFQYVGFYRPVPSCSPGSRVTFLEGHRAVHVRLDICVHALSGNTCVLAYL